MDELTAITGYTFRDKALSGVALTHRSASSRGRTQTYERLEFLGDRVLAVVIADLLYESFPDEDEGSLAKRLVALVRRETLADVARELGLPPLIRMSRGEEDAGGRDNPAMLADVCEALIGAIYRDGGLDAARIFIRRNWLDRMASTEKPPKDAKTELQEWAQGRGLELPEYREIGRTGPDHSPVFTIEVVVRGFTPVRGKGPTKRAAEQRAAERLLDRLETANG